MSKWSCELCNEDILKYICSQLPEHFSVNFKQAFSEVVPADNWHLSTVVYVVLHVYTYCVISCFVHFLHANKLLVPSINQENGTCPIDKNTLHMGAVIKGEAATGVVLPT